MKATYIVTDVADRIAPKWLANRISYKGVKFLYTFDDGKSVLKGVRSGDEVARIGDAIHFDGNRMSIERR